MKIKMTDEERCKYFLERKKRYCRMSVKKGKRFCGEHRNEDPENKAEIIDERITCPLDASHTCFKSKLMKHLYVCNARILRDNRPSYIVEGINTGNSSFNSEHVPLSEVSQTKLDAVLKKINKASATLEVVHEEILNHDVLKDELCNPKYGGETRKHLLQTSSLLGHLQKLDFINKDTCFVEFGAGRGKVTYWLAQVIKNQSGSSIVLVDRSSHRHKSENKLKNKDFLVNIQRVRADIADLKLNDVPAIQNTQCIVGFAKHLCGAATDLTIRCLTNSIKQHPHLISGGLVIAFCCHHRCDFSSYVGHEFLEKCEFTKDEFSILCSVASWATCGIKQKPTELSEREEYGRKVKALLNHGRLEYLKSFGFTGRLVHYTSADITLENMCIVATYKQSK